MNAVLYTVHTEYNIGIDFQALEREQDITVKGTKSICTTRM